MDLTKGPVCGDKGKEGDPLAIAAIYKESVIWT